MVNNYISAGSVILTEACNLKCTYCYENEKRNATKKMTHETARKAVEFFIDNAKRGDNKRVDITFFGGEPLLNLPVMSFMFDYAVQRCAEEKLQVGFSIVTNATMFTKEYETFLTHWYETTGSINIQLSIDGIPYVQDSNRIFASGEASSTAVVETVEKYHDWMKEHDVPATSVHVHGCITRESLPYLFDSYEYMRDVLHMDTIWFMPVHEEPWTEEDVNLFEEQLRKISDRIVDDCVKCGATYFFDNYSSFKCSTQKNDVPCLAGKEYCSIDTEGNIYACHRFKFSGEGEKIGTLETGINELARELLLEYDTNNLYGDVACSDCSNKNCYICIAANLHVNKNIAIGFPRYCKMSKKEEEIRWNTRQRLVEKGLIKDHSCNCNGSCSDTQKIVNEVKELYKPVFEGLDNQFKKIGDMSKEYAKSIGAVDVKAEEAINIAKEALSLSSKILDLVDGLYKEVEELKNQENKWR